MKTALITGKTDTPALSPLFDKLQAVLAECSWQSSILPKTYAPKKDFDIIFCIGGDGSFLSTCRTLASYGKPIVIIYAGRLGFLPCLLPEDITAEKIAPLLAKNAPWMQRMMLHGSSHKESLSALNEFYFTNDQKGSLSEYLVKINGAPVMTVRADGLIISSPTGSTAYNLSAGGPILMPSLQALVITPVCSHILGERPLVIGVDDRAEIINRNVRPSQVWADGQEMIPLAPEEAFTLALPLNVFCQPVSSHNFFCRLSQKLGWNSGKGNSPC